MIQGWAVVGKDPIGFAGELNVYAYAPNPVEWTSKSIAR